MLKRKLSLTVLAVVMISLSSCGIFHKNDCNCPHFGKVKTPVTQAQKGIA
jgi:hypothetical protein